MHEPPSQELVRQLTELQLCRPNDLKRARGRVRRLSYDLPAFDSVWIDSLVQLRLLTPYQARILEQGQAEQLRIGPYVVIDEMGRGAGRETYIAQQLNRRDRRVLKQYQLSAERIERVRVAMTSTLERAAGFAHPHVVLPSEVILADSSHLVTVSRFVPGLPINELLVRRGRFPAAVVYEIGRQLLDGLSALHKRSLVHGDIRMSNVRLTDHGLAVLVDGVSRPVIHPEITIHDTLTLEAYDGIAPELIGTGESATASSELYSLGCLLWQLLAGRPPYPTADPLAKLAAHQTQIIDDVRTWAPDTPPMLAQVIRQLTAPTPEERPRSADEILQRWGRPGTFSRSRLKQFRRLFEGDVPHFTRPVANDRFSSGVWMAAVLFAVTGMIGILYDAGLRSELLEMVDLAKDFTSARREPEARPIRMLAPKPALLPLPMPNEGVLLLDQPGQYEASKITHRGPLTIRGAHGVAAEILVEDSSLQISASSVTLEDVTFRRAPDASPGILVDIQSQDLQVRHCEFLSDCPNDNIGNEGVALAWLPPPGEASKRGALEVADTAFHGQGTAVMLLQLPRSSCIFSNTLKTGAGAFLKLPPYCHAAKFHVRLNHVTLRQSGAMMVLAGETASMTGAPPIAIEAENCVFDLADGSAGLIVFSSKQVRKDIGKSFAIDISNSIVAPDSELITQFLPEKNFATPVSEEEFGDQFSGLTSGQIQFAGNDVSNSSHARTVQVEGPRGTDDVLPGIDALRLGPSRRP